MNWRRVHEYGEQFALYPCEECGYRSTDLRELKNHIDEEYTDDSFNSLQNLGINQLPVVSKRRRHDFEDLAIDKEGNINIEEDDDTFDANSEELLLLDDDDDEEWSKPETPVVKTKRNINCTSLSGVNLIYATADSLHSALPLSTQC